MTHRNNLVRQLNHAHLQLDLVESQIDRVVETEHKLARKSLYKRKKELDREITILQSKIRFFNNKVFNSAA